MIRSIRYIIEARRWLPFGRQRVQAAPVGEGVEGVLALVGCKHYDGIERLRLGDAVFLQLEQDNEFDPEAVKVTDEFGRPVGYVSRFQAEIVRPFIASLQPPVLRGTLVRLDHYESQISAVLPETCWHELTQEYATVRHLCWDNPKYPEVYSIYLVCSSNVFTAVVQTLTAADIPLEAHGRCRGMPAKNGLTYQFFLALERDPETKAAVEQLLKERFRSIRDDYELRGEQRLLHNYRQDIEQLQQSREMREKELEAANARVRKFETDYLELFADNDRLEEQLQEQKQRYEEQLAEMERRHVINFGFSLQERYKGEFHDTLLAKIAQDMKNVKIVKSRSDQILHDLLRFSREMGERRRRMALIKRVWTSEKGKSRAVDRVLKELEMVSAQEGGHWKIRHQDDMRLMVTMPATGSDRRGMANNASNMLHTFF